MLLQEIKKILRVDEYYALRKNGHPIVLTIRSFLVAMAIYMLARTFIITVFFLLSQQGIFEIPGKRYSTAEWSFVNVAIVTPIFEEFQYRGILHYSRRNLSASLACWGLFFWLTTDIPDLVPLNYRYQNIIIILLLYSIARILIEHNRQLDKTLSDLQEKNRVLLIYLSSFAFGIMHLSKFEIEYTYQLIIALPYIVSGFILAYYRIRYGILASISMHAFNNALPFIFSK